MNPKLNINCLQCTSPPYGGAPIQQQHPVSKDSIGLLKKLAVFLLLGGVQLYALRGWPYLSIMAFDVFLILYFASAFKTKYRYLFFIQPIVLLISSQFFKTPFLELGDGKDYATVILQFADQQPGLNPLLEFNIFTYLKYFSFGVAPIFWIPELLYTNPTSEIFYLWQGTFHVLLCAISTTIIRIWNIIDKQKVFAITLFAIISPSFFDLGATPTRHIVTYGSIFLLYFSYLAIQFKYTFTRVLMFIISILLLVISKAVLLVPFIAFVLFDQIFLSAPISASNRNQGKILVIMLLFLVLIPGAEYLLATTLEYQGAAPSGAATFSNYTQIPIIGWFVKYVYALVSPFPWSEASLFTKDNYGGNGLLFIMHVFSGLFGLYFIFVVIAHKKLIFSRDSELVKLIVYGTIMSLSILWGSTGFHIYLLIYFPFFAPLLLVREYRVNVLTPLLFVGGLELFVFLFK